MCGIWALLGSGAAAYRGTSTQSEYLGRLATMAATVAHRGPDSFRFESLQVVSNCPCYLGFSRLSVMGGDYWMQPMRLKQYPYLWLIYNGEIYNYKKVERALSCCYETEVDGEAIIHLYAHGGPRYAAEMLDGVFAFCLLDTKERLIHIGRDTFGIKPLFTSLLDDALLLSSEAKGMLELCKGRQIDWVPPGHVQSFTILADGNISAQKPVCFHSMELRPKWDSLEDANLAVNFGFSESVQTTIRLLLSQAVKKRLMSARRIGALLSGGLDSSLIAALASQYMAEQSCDYTLQTFSIGLEGSHDVIAARKVADHIKSEHHVIPFSRDIALSAIRDVIYHMECYDHLPIRSGIPMYILAKYVRDRTDTVVVLCGEGADELTQGYKHFHQQPSSQAADQESRRLLREIYMFTVLRADRIAAAHGLEIRVPFLDHLFTSYFLSLPAELRRPTNGVEKFLLRKSFDGTGLLPAEILWRRKQEFSAGVSSDEDDWVNMLKGYLEEQVSDEMFAQAAVQFPFNTPATKEAYYCRAVFEEFYPGRAGLIPRPWRYPGFGDAAAAVPSTTATATCACAEEKRKSHETRESVDEIVVA